uniref:ribonuclease H n=1 Tax=Grammistes sexlineatus TaxID=270576 RepID=A0A1V1H6Q5_GRASX|nr:reverse transcriptase [Grammistes sexlineatus]
MRLLSLNRAWRMVMGLSRRLPPFVTVDFIIPWAPSPCAVCGLKLERINDAIGHALKVHRARKISYSCGRCEGTFDQLRRATCHRPKCGMARISNQGFNHACDHCTRKFSSLRGLSNHRRNMHSEIYLQFKRNMGKGCSSPLWAQDEVTYLQKLLQEKGGEPGIYSEACRHLSNRTYAQVRSKCKQLKKSIQAQLRGDSDNSSFDTSTLRVPLPPVPMVTVVIDCLDRTVIRGATEMAISPFTVDVQKIDRYLRSIIKYLKKSSSYLSSNQRRTNIKMGYKHLSKTKRAKYREVQSLYNRNKKKAASLILDGRANLACPIKPNIVYRAFCNIWGVGDCFSSLGQFGSLPQADNTPFCMWVTPEEVMAILKRSKKDSAPGPDGISKCRLLRWDKDGKQLANLFNAIIYCGKLPACLKGSRTTLIPKSIDPDKLKKIDQWRPITIGSQILRTFSGILAQRLNEACRVHARQKGFIDSPGCSENLSTLEGLLRLSKRDRKPLAVVFIDFAKAFDTVSHQHILEVLRMRGLDEHIVGLIKHSYEGCFTSIKTQDGNTERIYLKRGVKQDDPLSPTLFNLSVDPLLYTLERLGKGFSIQEANVASLAFADDLVLLSESWDGMTRNLAILEEFCRMSGLRVNPSKCHGFLLGISNRSYEINNCQPWQLFGTPFHMIGVSEAEKYLGVLINPLKGIVLPPIRETLQKLMVKLSKAPLKPTQRLLLLKNFAIPRILYVAEHGRAGHSILSECDRDIRSQVKAWLHLAPSTTNGVLYASPKDGGLGLSKLASQVPTLQLKRLKQLCNSKDMCTRNIARANAPLSTALKLWRRVQGEDVTPAPNRLEDIPELSPETWRKKEFHEWCLLKVQGLGTANFKADKTSNHWLRFFGQRMQESETILALQLRTNMVPTPSTRARGLKKSESELQCRLCQQGRETLRHIISNCLALQKKRMENHNKICAILQQEAENLGWSVRREPKLVSKDRRIGVPDLVLTKDWKAMILDVAIRFEASMSSLSEVNMIKINKYSVFKDTVKHLNPGVQQVLVSGFPLGARGKWFKNNSCILELIGCSRTRTQQLSSLLSTRALLFSVDLCKLYRNLNKM